MTIAGRLWLKLGGAAFEAPCGEAAWDDTTIDAGPLAGPLVNVLTGEKVEIAGGRLRLADAFRRFPGALLVPESLAGQAG